MTSENEKSDLIEVINQKTQTACDEIKADADAYACSRADAAKDFAAQLQRETELSIARLSEDIAAKSNIAARMECNKIALGARRKAIDRVYELLGVRLKNMSAEEFVKILSAIVLKYAERGQKLYLSANAPVSVDEVGKIGVVIDKNLTVTADDGLKNGFVLSGDNYDRDFSYESIVESLREQTERELAESMFGAEQ